MNKKNNGMMKNALYYVLVILAMVMVVYFILVITASDRQISSTQNSQNNYKQARSKNLKCSLQMVYIRSLVNTKNSRPSLTAVG